MSATSIENEDHYQIKNSNVVSKLLSSKTASLTEPVLDAQESTLITHQPSIIVGRGSFDYDRHRRHFKPTSDPSHHYEGTTFTFRDRLLKIKHSKLFSLTYIILIVLCIILLIWTIIKRGHPRELPFIFLEGLLTFFFLLDVALNLFIKGKTFFYSIYHVLDMAFCVFCFITFFSYVISRHLSAAEEIESLLDIIVLFLRFTIQMIRSIVFYIQRSKNGSDDTVNEPIIFHSDSQDDDQVDIINEKVGQTSVENLVGSAVLVDEANPVTHDDVDVDVDDDVDDDELTENVRLIERKEDQIISQENNR